MLKKIIVILSVSCLLAGCADSNAVRRNLLFSTEDIVAPRSSKYLTDLVDLETIDDQSAMDEYDRQLSQGAMLGSFHEFPTLEIGDISLNNIKKTVSSVSFDFLSSNDIADVCIEFYFDDKGAKNVVFAIPLAPASTVVECSVQIPNGVTKVGVHSINYEQTKIACGDTINLHESGSRLFMQSNNTLHFSCKETKRYFIMDELGSILDDVTLSGDGTIVTANGAVFAKEVTQY